MCSKYQLIISPKKSAIVPLHGHKSYDRMELEQFGIPLAKEYKYLGVLIDNKGKIKRHIANLRVKLGFIKF